MRTISTMQISPGADRLLREAEVAELLGVSVKSLRNWRILGRGPRFRKLQGWCVRYPLNDLKTFIAAQPTGGGDAGAA